MKCLLHVFAAHMILKYAANSKNYIILGGLHMAEKHGNTQFKDSVFICYLTESDERLVEIYNAVEGTTYPLDTPVRKNTLTDVLYKDRINDISFTLDGRTLVLFEHQSTVNENMPLRLLSYVARLYEKEVRANPDVSIYQRKRISLPAPKFVVLYNGKEPLPEHSTWKLSEAYMSKQENPALELNVEVYNINYSETSELLQKSTYLNEYSYFVYQVQEAQKAGKTISEAIRTATDICIAEGKMKDFLREHGMEVEKMLITEWDWDECLDAERKDARAEGHAEGKAEGKAEGRAEGKIEERENLIRKFSQKLSPDEIAETLQMPKAYVLQVLQDASTIN